MAKDEAIRNQKVFVRLDNVMDLQRRYERAKTGYDKAVGDLAQSVWKARKEAFEEVIAVLQLPMNQ